MITIYTKVEWRPDEVLMHRVGVFTIFTTIASAILFGSEARNPYCCEAWIGDTIRLAPHTKRPCTPVEDTAQIDGKMLLYLNDVRVVCIRCLVQ